MALRFACDAMLGGLARWLRAAGYETFWRYGIEDRDLVEKARSEGWFVLSSDEPLCRALGAQGLPPVGPRPAPPPPVGPAPHPPSLFIPRGMKKEEQLAHVLRALGLPVLDPRCMACGGSLRAATPGEAAAEAPPLTLQRVDRFWRCTGCARLLWEGTHWARIGEVLGRLGISREGSRPGRREDPPASSDPTGPPPAGGASSPSGAG